jgi:hypothetical protein
VSKTNIPECNQCHRASRISNKKGVSDVIPTPTLLWRWYSRLR